MAPITDYASLQSAIAGMLQRPNDPVIKDNLALFIQLTEVDLYDRLVLRDQEKEETLTLSVGDNYVALPSDYVSPISLWLIIDGVRSLMTKVLPTDLPYDTDSTIPCKWAIDGADIRFDCPSDKAYLAPFRYVASSSLSDATPTNYLLLRRPDVYLFGDLKHACNFTEDDAALQKWALQYEAAIRSISSAESQSRKTPLRTELCVSERSNILRG